MSLTDLALALFGALRTASHWRVCAGWHACWRGGASVALTPDGPRGPAHKCALGPLALAQITDKPIVPMCWVTDRYWRASGWDRMFIPKPFSRGRFVMGAPPYVSAKGRRALEVTRQQLEVALNDLEVAAKRLPPL